MSSKKVAIIGEYYSSNLGDAVIVDTVSALFQQKQCKIEIFDLMGKKDWSFDHKQPEINFLRVKKFIPKFFKQGKREIEKFFRKSHFLSKFNSITAEDYSGVVFAGGQIFMEHFVDNIILLLKFFEAQKIPVVFNNVGLGELSKHSFEKLIGVLSSPNVILITMRDGKESLQKFLPEIQEGIDSVIVHQQVFGLENAIKSKGKIIGLGVMELPGKRAEVMEFWLSLIPWIESNGYDWEVFGNGLLEDKLLAAEILKALGREDKKVHSPRSAAELVNEIRSYAKIIAFRLHAHVIAYSYDIPSFGLSWDNKVEAFFEKVHQNDRVQEWATLDVHTINLEKLLYDQMSDSYKVKWLKEIDKQIQTICNLFEARELEIEGS